MDISKEKPKFYHFTKTENLESIFVNGLLAAIGDNSKGAEKSKKVFFSADRYGVLKAIDVWLRWMIVRYQKINYVKTATTDKGIYPKESPNMDLQYTLAEIEALQKHVADVETGAVETEEAKLAAFKKVYKDWKKLSYLSLDLKEGEDFSFDDIDEPKQWNAKNRPDMKYLSYMYRPYNNNQDNALYGKFTSENIKVEGWNMHTFKGKGVSPERIKQISCGDKTDGLSIVLELFRQEKEDNKDFSMPLLEEWVECVLTLQANETITKFSGVQAQEHLDNPGHFDYLLP